MFGLTLWIHTFFGGGPFRVSRKGLKGYLGVITSLFRIFFFLLNVHECTGSCIWYVLFYSQRYYLHMQPVTAQPTTHSYIHNNTKKKKEKAFHTELPGTKSDQRRLPEQPCIVSGPLHVKQLRSLFSLCMCCILLLHAMRAEVSRLRDCARDPRWMAARQEDCLCLRTEKVLCSQPLPSPSPCCCIRPTHTAPPPPKFKNYPAFHEAGDHTLLPCKRSNRAI